MQLQTRAPCAGRSTGVLRLIRVPSPRSMNDLRQKGLRTLSGRRGTSPIVKAQSTGWNPIEGIQKALQQVISPGSTPATDGADGADVKPAAVLEIEEEKSDEYTQEMQQKMGTSLTYRHEDGINWNLIMPDLIVGSCLQTPADADRLAAAGITTVFNLQEDCDMEYFDIDIAGIQKRCKEVGIKHVRFPIRDFDPFDLRLKLPKAVSKLANSHEPRTGIVYIHCTAGLGRAPATALAYMYWLRGWELNEAHQALTSTRTCSPRIESIRAATADLLTGTGPIPMTIGLRRRGTAQSVQVAGLDVGWHTRLDMSFNPKTQRMEITRPLLPGSYPFKFVVDDVWTASADHPTYQDGANTNNVLTVLPREAKDLEVRERLLSPDGKLTEDERLELAAMLCPWESHDLGLIRSGPDGAAKEGAPATAEAAAARPLGPSQTADDAANSSY